MRGSGDGFLRCSDGHSRWGIHGAAGVLFVHRGDDGVDRFMIQLRSKWSHEGGTWAIAGGALDKGETPLEGALREAAEEVGEVPPYRVIGEYVFAPASDWSYTTAVVEVDEQFGHPTNFESDALRWCTAEEIDRLRLHNGFAAAWPHLQAIVNGR